MGDDEGVAEVAERVGQGGAAGGAEPADARVEPDRPLDDVDRHHPGRALSTPLVGSGEGCPLDGVVGVEGVEEVGRELAAPGADVDDDRAGAPPCSRSTARSRASARTPRSGRASAVVKCAAGPAARDVETPPGGIQRVVPGLAPGNGIHASRTVGDSVPWVSTPHERPARFDVGVVGAGRVGAVLGAALPVPATSSRASPPSARRASSGPPTLLPGVPVKPIPEVVPGAHLVVLAVPDDALADLVAGLSATGTFTPGQLVMHTSGAHGISVFEAAAASDIVPLALHPAMTFTGHRARPRAAAGLLLRRHDGRPRAAPRRGARHRDGR